MIYIYKVYMPVKIALYIMRFFAFFSIGMKFLSPKILSVRAKYSTPPSEEANAKPLAPKGCISMSENPTPHSTNTQHAPNTARFKPKSTLTPPVCDRARCHCTH